MFYDTTFIILIPAIIFAFYAQAKVSSAYNRYAKVANRNRVTGAQAARKILDINGMQSVPIEITEGKLSDHYDPSKRVMRLSPEVYNTASVAAVSIAAHEAGHAIQHNTGYSPLNIRNAMVPVVNIASTLSWPLLIIGLIIGVATPNGGILFNVGVLFFLGVVLFHAVTLPVEFNASNRAIRQLTDLNIIYPDEASASKKVLSAAAMTYVAALAMAIANLIRILILRRDS